MMMVMATDINLGHYSGNPADNPRDAVRLLIGDNKEPCRFTDAEVEYFLDEAGGDAMKAAQSVMAVQMSSAAVTAGTRTIGKTTIEDRRTDALKASLSAMQAVSSGINSGAAVPLFDVEGASPSIFDYGMTDNPYNQLPGGPHEPTSPLNGNF
jgi:hypothetical protein